MNIFVNVSIVVANIIIGLLVLTRNPKKPINIIFFLFTASISLWVLTLALYYMDFLPSVILILGRLNFLFVILVAVFLLNFSYIFPSNFSSKHEKVFLRTSYLIGFGLSILTQFTDLIIKDEIASGSMRQTVFGSLFFMFVIYFVIAIISSPIIMIMKYKSSNGYIRSQILIVAIAVFLSSLFALITNILVPILFNIDYVAKYGPIFTTIFVVLTMYAILRRKMMDIRMAVFRSLGYIILLAVLAFIYTTVILGTEIILNPNALSDINISQYIIRAVTALVLVFLFQPIRKWISKVTDRIFFKHSYDPELLIDTATRKVSSTLKVKDILDGVNKAFVDNIKLSRCAIVLFNEDQTIYAKQSVNWGSLQTDELFELAKSGRLVSDDLEESDNLKQMLQTKNILFAAPVMNGKKILGIFVSGEKSSGELFNAQDQRVISIILQSMALATENAKSYEQIEAFNITLRQKIAEATQELRVKNAMLKKLDKAKDEFVSMASHQLRTPLTSVKGYLSMVVEGDAGKVTDQQKQLLTEAYSSNERMVNLVNDFLNVSRIQTGKFMLEKVPVDLTKLVDEEVKSLVPNALKRQIKLDYKAPSGVPELSIDEGKIRQVVMNYIDNAIYYSNMDSTIKIDLSVEGDDVVFTVKDTGIGVPISEQAGLFTKFYRASNAKKQRPDGTGVGLYLAKKIITAHDGKIVFSTIEGKGSTFGFRLPINELKISADKEIENLKD